MRAFFIGLQFLTRISIVHQDHWTVEDFGRSVKFFPLIGAVLGAIYAGAAYLLLLWLPAQGLAVPLYTASVLLLVLPPLLTGGLHCDGFMDTMDGVFSGRSRERMLEIMKDSCVGSNGVFCFVVLMLLEWGILLDLLRTPALLVPAFFVMPIIARLMMTGAVVFYPYARPEGMGKAFAEHTSPGTAVFAALTSLLLVLPWGLPAALALFVSLLFTAFFASFVVKKLGGLTGDIYGAITMLNEGLVLLVFLAAAAIL